MSATHPKYLRRLEKANKRFDRTTSLRAKRHYECGKQIELRIKKDAAAIIKAEEALGWRN